jgi:hypothetical protein
MIVRDLGDAWQIVLQTDHADLSGAFARAWAEPVSRSLQIVAERHDDGWAVWEQAPMVDPQTRAPVNFLDVGVPAHLAFYRAGIVAVAEQDAGAGLLLRMHGAGIYRQRYGLDPGLGLSRAPEVEELVDAFVAEQEEAFGGSPQGEQRLQYELLQVFDRFSLYFCMRDGEPADVQGYGFDPVAPWHVRMEPYPFAERPGRFSLLRRVLPKADWTDDEFRSAFFALEPERTAVTIEPAA